MPASWKTWHSDLKFCQSLIFLDFLGASHCCYERKKLESKIHVKVI